MTDISQPFRVKSMSYLLGGDLLSSSSSDSSEEWLLSSGDCACSAPLFLRRSGDGLGLLLRLWTGLGRLGDGLGVGRFLGGDGSRLRVGLEGERRGLRLCLLTGLPLWCWFEPRVWRGLLDRRLWTGGLGLLLFLGGEGLDDGWRLRGCLAGERLWLWLLPLKGLPLLRCWFVPRVGTGLLDRRLLAGELAFLWILGGVTLPDCWRLRGGAGGERCGLRL